LPINTDGWDTIGIKNAIALIIDQQKDFGHDILDSDAKAICEEIFIPSLRHHIKINLNQMGDSSIWQGNYFRGHKNFLMKTLD